MTPYRSNARPPGALRRAITFRERAAVVWRRWWRRRLEPVLRFVSIWEWARELGKKDLELEEAQRELVRIRKETEALLQAQTLTNKTVTVDARTAIEALFGGTDLVERKPVDPGDGPR